MTDLQSTSNNPLEQKILQIADELQIDATGFASLAPISPKAQEEYQQWIEAGNHAEMEYLERNVALRFDPSDLLEGAQSVIVIAISYYPTALQHASAPQVAKYAYGRDYHKVLKKLLQTLGERIHNEVAPHQFRALVDTAPLMERYWAVQAGLGFIGRNRTLIIPKKGSFFFLGELLTTLELKGDEPVRGGCGRCRRCVDACPTGALSIENGLDARRCISYLTIEHRGEIPSELSCRFGNRLYGCDTCQDVCPHNRRPIPSRHFTPSPNLLALSDHDLSPLTEERYAQLFFGTAATRAKYEGMSRNAEIYLGNKE